MESVHEKMAQPSVRVCTELLVQGKGSGVEASTFSF